MRALVLASLLPAAACFSDAGGDTCRTDRDCSGLVCTRVGDCASTDGIYALRIEWTVNGQTTDQAGVCASVGELAVSVSDPTSGDSHTVRPVLCTLGSFFYDKLPLSFTDVEVTAYSPGGDTLDVRQASAVGAGGLVRVDLSL